MTGLPIKLKKNRMCKVLNKCYNRTMAQTRDAITGRFLAGEKPKCIDCGGPKSRNKNYKRCRMCSTKFTSKNLGKYLKGNTWAKGKVRSKEHCMNLSKSCKGRVSSTKGRHLSEEVREKLRLATLKGRLKQARMKTPTSIEKAVYDYLLLKGIIFEKQKPIGNKFIVDAYIPSLNLVVEADGSYWHSTPRGIKTDVRKNKLIKQEGYNLLRLTETEIKDGSFKERMGI